MHLFFVPLLPCTCDGLLSWSLSSWYHTSSAAVKVKCLLTWPPCIIDCGVTWCACVRMHVTLWLHTAGSVGVVWKHLQLQDPVGAWLYRAGFISVSLWMGRVELFGVFKRYSERMWFVVLAVILMEACPLCVHQISLIHNTKIHSVFVCQKKLSEGSCCF